MFELLHAEDVAEWRVVSDFGDRAIAHEKTLEDRLVEQLAGALAGRLVGTGAVGGEAEGDLQDLLPFGQSGVYTLSEGKTKSEYP